MSSKDLSQLCADLKLDESDGPFIWMGRDSYEERIPRMDLCLIGKILENRFENKQGLDNVLKFIWRMDHQVKVEPKGIPNLNICLSLWKRGQSLEGLHRRSLGFQQTTHSTG
ncbi:Endonuclease/exonuclease/phosphatase [Abeliophyllum distichum]|uniref:Endonuclease/exonuclease/phosphatase n=1 Tax=Abeliophyllum distichum TaxID=126358 RepID=A0ABD1QZE9_9LAMI